MSQSGRHLPPRSLVGLRQTPISIAIIKPISYATLTLNWVWRHASMSCCKITSLCFHCTTIIQISALPRAQWFQSYETFHQRRHQPQPPLWDFQCIAILIAMILRPRPSFMPTQSLIQYTDISGHSLRCETFSVEQFLLRKFQVVKEVSFMLAPLLTQCTAISDLKSPCHVSQFLSHWHTQPVTQSSRHVGLGRLFNYINITSHSSGCIKAVKFNSSNLAINPSHRILNTRNQNKASKINK